MMEEDTQKETVEVEEHVEDLDVARAHECDVAACRRARDALTEVLAQLSGETGPEVSVFGLPSPCLIVLLAEEWLQCGRSGLLQGCMPYNVWAAYLRARKKSRPFCALSLNLLGSLDAGIE